MREITENGIVFVVDDNYPEPPYSKYAKMDPNIAQDTALLEAARATARRDTEGMVRRRAKKLQAAGKVAEAIRLLNSIGG